MEKSNVEIVLALTETLSGHKAQNAVALDFRALEMWTDFFVIGTVTSAAHLSGLLRHIKDFANDKNLTFRHSSAGKSTAAGIAAVSITDNIIWDICELGGFCVVHLMSEQARDFYELERLWSSAERLLG
ncbi:MAG: ribosome silencing factor [Spirochaetaceae bacterium]|jgi:ribosome-associated protein|nr:ribosome silencing factor [Spirochaetaceae bacterium]